ncbi:hypothetical protein AX16_003422 [Volvariella volvacea WC 439]|nr:hypothetical protein AX16_003422 [Volvariella volvacea WC 439]
MEGTKLYTDFLNYSTVKNSYALSAINRFWSRTFSWATLLFYLNRYGALAAHIPVLMEYFWTSFTTPEERVTTFVTPYF